MALKKVKISRGQECEYWSMTDYRKVKREGNTYCTLTLFKDKESREADILNNGYEEQTFGFVGLLTETQCYETIKKSDTQAIIVIPAIDEVVGLDGEIITQREAAVTEDREMNFFADAVNV